MPFTPLTPEEERRVLSAVGVQSVDDLFAAIPPRLRENAELTLDFGAGIDGNRGLTEHELRRLFSGYAAKNASLRHFLGGGTYDGIQPAAVAELASRGEFLTAPPPVDPAGSQGTLRALAELQEMAARIAGLPFASVSLDSGSVATAEAALMAKRLSPEPHRRLLAAASLSPGAIENLDAFLSAHPPPREDVRWTANGTLDLAHLEALCKNGAPCALVVQSPNRFGVLEPLAAIREKLPEGCLLVASLGDATAPALFNSPGELGADLVAGDLQSVGLPMSFGGARAGFIAFRAPHRDSLPGWIVEKADDGRLAATYPAEKPGKRPAHGLPTGPGLDALRAVFTLSLLGKQGYRRLGEINHALFCHLRDELAGIGIPLVFGGALHYREGVFQVPNLALRFRNALKRGIIPGLPLGEGPSKPQGDFSNCLLVCCHPKHTRSDIDELVEVLSHD